LFVVPAPLRGFFSWGAKKGQLEKKKPMDVTKWPRLANPGKKTNKRGGIK